MRDRRHPWWIDFEPMGEHWPSGRIGALASATAGYVHAFTNGDVGHTSFNMTPADARNLAALLVKAADEAEGAAACEIAAAREGAS